MKNIRKVLETITPIEDSEWEFFASKLNKVEVKKKTSLLKIGAVESNFTFITEGVIRSFIPKQENDITFSFAFENEFVSGFDSFLTQAPSQYSIETLTDSILWQFTYEDLQSIYDHTKVGCLIGRKIAEGMFLIKSKREISLLNRTAEERYLDLFTEHPKLLQEVPLKYIASYIGVTPQGLSRIRKRIC